MLRCSWPSGGDRVTLADRVPIELALFPRGAAEGIAWQFADIGSADFDALVQGVDVVHHYAWGSIPASANANPAGDLVTNVGATLALLDALHRRGDPAVRVVFASSGGTVYGKLTEVPVPENHRLRPITAYGAGKATAETYLALYRDMYGLDCRVARISNPYGAGQDLARGQGAATTFLHKALTGQPIDIWGTGEVVRDYIHISDVARGLVVLADAPRGEQFVFNVGSGTGTSLNAIVAELEAQLGRALVVRRTEGRAFDVPASVLCVERAARELGWSAALSFSAGIALTLEDFRAGARFSSLL